MLQGHALAAWIVSNVFALALIVIAWRLPKVCRAILGLGFTAAALFNAVAVLANPQAYVLGFGPQALFPFYENFIYGPFARHTTAFVLVIAAGQLAIGLLMFARGTVFRIGLAGGMLFFLAIAPLGQGSALPMPLLGIVALWVLWNRTP
jgi:hypothetical protein